MYQAMAIIAGTVVLITFLKLVLNRKWKLFYTALGSEEYFRIVGKLKNEGVKYKVETPVTAMRVGRYRDDSQYEIYVKEEYESKAHAAIRK